MDAGGSWSLYDMAIIGNTIFVLHSNNPGGEMYRFNRATGQFQSDINLEPTYTFLGSMYPWVNDSTNQEKRFTGIAYDRTNNRAYFLIFPNNGVNRVLGYVEEATEAALETTLITGTFNITLLPHAPIQMINSLVWLPPYV